MKIKMATSVAFLGMGSLLGGVTASNVAAQWYHDAIFSGVSAAVMAVFGAILLREVCKWEK